MGHEVRTGAEERLGILQVVQVRGHAQAALVRLIDDGAVDRFGHLAAAPQGVFHPDLHDVDVHVDHLVHSGPGVLRRLRRDDGTGDVEPGSIQFWRVSCRSRNWMPTSWSPPRLTTVVTPQRAYNPS